MNNKAERYREAINSQLLPGLIASGYMREALKDFTREHLQELSTVAAQDCYRIAEVIKDEYITKEMIRRLPQYVVVMFYDWVRGKEEKHQGEKIKHIERIHNRNWRLDNPIGPAIDD